MKDKDMNKHYFYLTLLIFTSLTFSQQQTLIYKDARIITVYGEGIVDTIADVAYLTYSVKGFGSKFKDAVAEATQKNEKVVEKLVNIGLPNRNIQSSSFYSGQNYLYKPLFSKSKDYQASFSVVIKIDSLNMIDNIIIMLSEQDIENLSNVTFSLSELLNVQKIARNRAIDDARKQATEISEKCNVTLGKLISYSEIDGSNESSIEYELSQLRKKSEVIGYLDNPTPVYIVDADDSGNAYSTFSPNRMKISKRIKTVYEIEEGKPRP